MRYFFIILGLSLFVWMFMASSLVPKWEMRWMQIGELSTGQHLLCRSAGWSMRHWVVVDLLGAISLLVAISIAVAHEDKAAGEDA
jgi:hypothetical protein